MHNVKCNDTRGLLAFFTQALEERKKNVIWNFTPKMELKIICTKEVERIFKAE